MTKITSISPDAFCSHAFDDTIKMVDKAKVCHPHHLPTLLDGTALLNESIDHANNLAIEEASVFGKRSFFDLFRFKLLTQGIKINACGQFITQGTLLDISSWSVELENMHRKLNWLVVSNGQFGMAVHCLITRLGDIKALETAAIEAKKRTVKVLRRNTRYLSGRN